MGRRYIGSGDGGRQYGGSSGGGRYQPNQPSKSKTPNFSFSQSNPNPNSNPQFSQTQYPTNQWWVSLRQQTDRATGCELQVSEPGGGGSEQFWRLTPREMRKRGENGLCFQYDGKWGRNHVCSRKELSVIIETKEEVEEPNLEEEKFRRRRKRKDMKSKKKRILVIIERCKCSRKLRKKGEKVSVDSLLYCGSGGGPGEARKLGGGGTRGDNGQPEKWAIWVYRAEFCFSTFPPLATQVTVSKSRSSIYK